MKTSDKILWSVKPPQNKEELWGYVSEDGVVSIKRFNSGNWELVRGLALSNSIETDMIKSGVVTNEKIANSAVNANKLASNSVTSAKIASSAVTEAKIADNSVSESKLSQSVRDKLITFIDLDSSTIFSGSNQENVEEFEQLLTTINLSDHVLIYIDGVLSNIDFINETTLTLSNNHMDISSNLLECNETVIRLILNENFDESLPVEGNNIQSAIDLDSTSKIYDLTLNIFTPLT